MFTYELTQISRAAASASGSPACSCLLSAAEINSKDTNDTPLEHDLCSGAGDRIPTISRPTTHIWHK